MNYLAHLQLARVSGTSPAGNLLGDFVKGAVPDDLARELAIGIRLHRRIDVFTDAHPEHRAVVASFQPPWRRFGGILADMLYDHFLSLHWSRFSRQPLPEFLDYNYAVLLGSEVRHPALFPEGLPRPLRRMAEQDWLSTYARIDGLRQALDGIGRRLRRPIALGDGLDTIDGRQWAAMEEGFLRFYPQLITYAAAEAITISTDPALQGALSDRFPWK